MNLLERWPLTKTSANIISDNDFICTPLLTDLSDLPGGALPNNGEENNWVEGIFGKSISSPAWSKYPIDFTGKTISFWVKLPELSSQKNLYVILSDIDNVPLLTYGAMSYTATTRFFTFKNGIKASVSSSAITPNSFANIIIDFSNGYLYLASNHYGSLIVDRNRVRYTFSTTNSYNTDKRIKINTDLPIMDFRIYSGSPSTKEITELQKGLVASYNFGAQNGLADESGFFNSFESEGN